MTSVTTSTKLSLPEDELVAAAGVRLVVAFAGRYRCRSGRRDHPVAKSGIQTVTLLRAHPESTRRASGEPGDGEKARAKERVFSFRDEFGQWGPGRLSGRNCNPTTDGTTRAELRLPLSNWTAIPSAPSRSGCRPSISAHRRKVLSVSACCWPCTRHMQPRAMSRVFEATVRFRTVGDVDPVHRVRRVVGIDGHGSHRRNCGGPL